MATQRHKGKHTMKSAVVAVLALAEIGTGTMQGEPVSAKAVVQAPKDFVGRTIVLPAIPCVDDPKGGFLCIAIVGGQALRIEAGALGARTKLEIAQRLTGDCKGTANLDRSACRFDAEITPRNAMKDIMETPSGSMPLVLIYSGAIELFTPRRK